MSQIHPDNQNPLLDLQGQNVSKSSFSPYFGEHISSHRPSKPRFSGEAIGMETGRACVEMLSMITSQIRELTRLVEQPQISQRYYNLQDAARYCGMAGKDERCRKFLKFVDDERISFKQGNTESQKMFDKLELDRAMKEKCKTLS